MKAHEKSESLERVTAGVAHSFNNLLTVIQGFSTMELARVTGQGELTQSLKAIAGAAERGAKIAGQLLAYSSQQIMYPQTFDLNDHLVAVAPELQKLAGGNIVLNLDLGADLPTFLADVEHFDEILMELVSNARNAITGGGTIIVRSELVDVKAEHVPAGSTMAAAGPHFRITVEDTGRGMEPSVVKELFEPFFRDKDEVRGMGMGLAAAQGIARQHRGWIEVETAVGVGSAFHLHLPATL